MPDSATGSGQGVSGAQVAALGLGVFASALILTSVNGLAIPLGVLVLRVGPGESRSLAHGLLVYLVAAIGLGASFLVLKRPRVAGALLLVSSVLALLFGGAAMIAYLMAAIVAFRVPLPRSSRPIAALEPPESPDRQVMSGRVAATVRLVQYDKPVPQSQVAAAVSDLEALRATGGIDEGSYREYRDVLVGSAGQPPT